MAAIKVHGTPFSTATARVLVTLHEKEVDYELVPVDMKAGEHKKESFLSLNPFGQVPAFEDGDLKLFESRAITKYIAHQYADKGSQLVCGDVKQKSIIGVWIEVEAHQFDPIASKLSWELALKPLFVGEEEEEEDDEEVGGMGFGEDEKPRRDLASAGRRGSGSGGSAPPNCQVENCNADLSEAKHYHRRHKVCDVHAKAAYVLVAGSQKRFCQQCSRFHELSEFDEFKRSCRKRLAGHNERRRKSSSSEFQREGSH